MNVNNKKRGRPKNKKLNVETIISEAQRMLFTEKKNLSIRGLARRLNVDPMAIYYYFDSKAALLEAVTTAIMEEMYMPDSEGDWNIELERLAESYLTLLKDHPGLLETLLTMASEGYGPVAIFTERFNIAISSLELDDDSINTAINLLVDYLHGFAFALECAKDKVKPEISDMKDPFALYLLAIRQLL